jgi:signal transduction histidine kinase
LKRYVDALKEQSGMEMRLAVMGIERRLQSYQEVMIFRAIQELLNNASRHSSAMQVNVQLDMGETDIKVVVDDNGKGFDKADLPERGGMGLKVIRDRVEMLGGSIEIDTSVGKGTRVTFQIPAASASPEAAKD